MRRLLLALIAVAFAAQPARAQLSVYDPANTARNTISAIYQQYLLFLKRSPDGVLEPPIRTPSGPACPCP